MLWKMSVSQNVKTAEVRKYKTQTITLSFNRIYKSFRYAIHFFYVSLQTYTLMRTS